MSRPKLRHPQIRGEKHANFLYNNVTDPCNNNNWNVFMSINSTLQGRMKPGEICMTGMLKSPLITCLGKVVWTKRNVKCYSMFENYIICLNLCQLSNHHSPPGWYNLLPRVVGLHLRQLHAVLGLWVHVEVEGLCFHRHTTPSSSFQEDATETCNFLAMEFVMKLWSAFFNQGQVLLICRSGVSFVHWSRVPRDSMGFSGGKVWECTEFSVNWGRLSQLL